MFLRRLNAIPDAGWTTPFDELERMRRQMDQLAGQLSSGRSGVQFAGVYPLLNITEDNDNYYIRAEIPGQNPDELDLNVTGDSFTISGERRLDSQKEGVRYHRREREAGKFNRVVSLPGPVDTEKVSAQNKNGVLTVTLPKAEASKPKKITIKGS